MCISVAYCHGLQRQVHGTLPFLAVPWQPLLLTATAIGSASHRGYARQQPYDAANAAREGYTLRGCRQWRPWSLLLVQ